MWEDGEERREDRGWFLSLALPRSPSMQGKKILEMTVN